MKEFNLQKYIRFNSEVDKVNIINIDNKTKYEIECNNEVSLFKLY